MREERRSQQVSVPPMVELHARQIGGRWFGLAHAGAGLAATAVGSTRAETLDSLRRSLPSGVGCRLADEDRSAWPVASSWASSPTGAAGDP